MMPVGETINIMRKFVRGFPNWYPSLSTEQVEKDQCEACGIKPSEISQLAIATGHFLNAYDKKHEDDKI